VDGWGGGSCLHSRRPHSRGVMSSDVMGANSVAAAPASCLREGGVLCNAAVTDALRPPHWHHTHRGARGQLAQLTLADGNLWPFVLHPFVALSQPPATHVHQVGNHDRW
jgi:hypothetical protein